MASLFKVKALYDFEAKEEDDLGFPSGQIIDVTEEVDDNWLEGRYTDANGGNQAGIFPREFVEKYEPEVPTRPSRPARAKQEITTSPSDQAPVPAAVPEPSKEEEETPAAAPTPKVQAAPPTVPAVVRAQASVSESANDQPPPAPKVAPAEPAVTSAKKAPPPIAAKSNAFRDRIAAFNQPAAAPIAPIIPGAPKPQSNTFIKRPFVAPPPSSNAYVPPPKVETIHKPYIRDEDPEIRRRQEEDRAAAEAAGLAGDEGATTQGEQGEDAPKPQTLKERIARLQQQQLEQAQRRADGGQKKEKKPPAKKPTDPSDVETPIEGDDESLHQVNSAETTGRQSLDISRDRPRVPSTQRRPPEPSASLPSAPEHEILSDGNEADQSAAGETTEDDTGTIGPDDEEEKHPYLPRATGAPKHEADVGDEEDTTEDGEDIEEDEVDEETRRRLELRERMAKMSGGMGMAGMFGPAGGMPMPGAAVKKRSTKEKKPSEDSAPASPPMAQPRIPMIPIPGMQRVQSPESDDTQYPERNDEAADEGDVTEGAQSKPMPRRSMTEERGAPPPIPKESRPPPPPVHGATAVSRPVPPPPPTAAAPMSPDPGSESDDEMSVFAKPSTGDDSTVETPGPLPIRSNTGGMAPPVPGSRDAPPPRPHSPENRRSSYFGSEASPIATDKRASRVPPPVPGSPLASARPPPPPPPAQEPPSRRATEEDTGRGESEYEGDYDTDIASSAKHKDALKAHVREPSLDDSTTADETPISSPPQLPQPLAHRSVPPPPPPSQAPKARQSMDAPRAPPPMPPSREIPREDAIDEYDPYRYDHRAAPPPPGEGPPVPSREAEKVQESSADDMYSASPPRQSMDRPPPPPPHATGADRPAPPPPSQVPPSVRTTRPSLDVYRSNTTTRRSMDQPRQSMEQGQIATDVDLPESPPWWTTPQALPPSFQNRSGVDILTECEESSTSKRGGRTTISKDIYVLFIDYSQTIITARYDSREPSDVQIEQRHEPPPPKLRQDQLEGFWQRFGRAIAEAAASHGHSKKDSVVGDGSPTALVSELLKARPDALQPVGTRAYGALIYHNLANTTSLQYDEIRPGDIVTVRNAKFEGHHGAMKSRYKQEYGPSHVAVVEEWDGTKRAIRAWEQGREKKGGVRSEKFRLGDLRSGEVRVWRVVGREWVNWDAGA